MADLESFIELCGNEPVAQYLFDRYAEKYTPEEALDISVFDGEILQCPHCEYLFHWTMPLWGTVDCPQCGKVVLGFRDY